MNSHDGRTARRIAEIKALEEELTREATASTTAASASKPSPSGQRRRSAVLDAVALAGIIALFLVLSGSCITLMRWSGRDFADAERAGWAAVDHCRGQGPVTNRGFGYWETCSATIRWDDGDVSRLTSDAVFTSADIGHDIRVGDNGRHRQTVQLSREDKPQRLWLAWVGGLFGLASLPPGFLAFFLIKSSLRRRRR